ncbi:MAG TPA: hypothetical protein VLV78_10835 [Thermoanaerobaculia bacterium]|nr:hypothetical protein [Thermoanaerobaculia bacterium]
MKRLFLTALVFAAFLSCATGRPQWTRRLGYSTGELSRLEIGKHGYPVLAGRIDRNALHLVFDTGNMSGLLLSIGAINALHLSMTGQTRSYDSDGRELPPVREFHVPLLEIFGQAFRNQHAIEDVRAEFDGFVGPMYLLHGRFTLDYRTGWMGVSKRPLRAPASSALPLLRSESFPGMVVVRGTANAVPVLFQLDTGKSRTCIDSELRRRLQLPADPNGVRGLTVTIADSSFAIPAAKEVGFRGISAGYPEPILVGIGSDVLSKGVLTVDYANGIVLFESR